MDKAYHMCVLFWAGVGVGVGVRICRLRASAYFQMENWACTQMHTRTIRQTYFTHKQYCRHREYLIEIKTHSNKFYDAFWKKNKRNSWIDRVYPYKSVCIYVQVQIVELHCVRNRLECVFILFVFSCVAMKELDYDINILLFFPRIVPIFHGISSDKVWPHKNSHSIDFYCW